MLVVNTCDKVAVEWSEEIIKEPALMIVEVEEDEGLYFILDILDDIKGIVLTEVDELDFTECQIIVLYDKARTSVEEIVNHVAYVKEECDLWCRWD